VFEVEKLGVICSVYVGLADVLKVMYFSTSNAKFDQNILLIQELAVFGRGWIILGRSIYQTNFVFGTDLSIAIGFLLKCGTTAPPGNWLPMGRWLLKRQGD
jgi:hypothetical protein